MERIAREDYRCQPDFCPTKGMGRIKNTPKNSSSSKKSKPLVKKIFDLNGLKTYSLKTSLVTKAIEKYNSKCTTRYCETDAKYWNEFGYTVVLHLNEPVVGEIYSPNFKVGNPSLSGKILSFATKSVNYNDIMGEGQRWASVFGSFGLRLG